MDHNDYTAPGSQEIRMHPIFLISPTFDAATNYALQQNAIPVIKKLHFQNDATVRKELIIRLTTESAFAAPAEVRIQAIAADGEFRVAPLDLKLSKDYLLDVEFDGATYDRAATARDRDKLRQMILEGLGWKLRRIWSTDWWHDANKEMDKLIEALAALRLGFVAP